MALRLNDSQSDSHSKASSDSLDENLDITNKYKSNLPLSKKKKPKRNRSAFIIFSSEQRQKIRSEQKVKLNSNEMMSKLADLWKNLPEEQKKQYYDIAEKEKVRYLLELNDFYQNHPFEIIQNKTKKNHVKKPCSAYALYLKEMKKKIKETNPELKMADILKLVGDKWKNLPEEEKSVYQDKAQAEKEVTKAKLNEHMLRDIEDLKKAPIPQKRVQNQKRIQKALLKEQAQLDPYQILQAKRDMSQFRPKFDDSMIFKQQFTGQNNMSRPQSNVFDFDFNHFNSMFQNNDRNNNDNSFMNAGWGNKEDPNMNREASFLLSLCETTNRVAKKSSDLILDLITFQSKQERAPSQSESTIISSSGANRVPNQNANLSTRAQMLNETLINCLNFEPSTDFNFDSLDNEANFDEIPYWN